MPLTSFVMHVSLPGNHKGISKSLGYGTIAEYRYWDAATRSIDFAGMMEDLRVKLFSFGS